MVGVDVHPLGVLDLLYKRIFRYKDCCLHQSATFFECANILLFYSSLTKKNENTETAPEPNIKGCNWIYNSG